MNCMSTMTKNNIKLTLLGDAEKHLWGEFLRNSLNHVFYQELDYLDFYHKKTDEVLKMVFRKNGRILAILPAGLRKRDGVNKLYAPFSASFGAFSYKNDLKLEEAREIVELLLNECRKQNVSDILIKQPPQIYYSKPNEYMEFALESSGFKTSRRDVTLFIKCQKDPLDSFGSTARNIIRRSIKEGFVMEPSTEQDAIIDLIVESKRQKELSMSVPKQDMLELTRRFREKIKYFAVKDGTETIAGAIIYLLNNRTMLVMYWAQNAVYAKKSPTYFLIHELAKWGREQGISYLDFGTTTLEGQPVQGVTDFKEKFNPSGVIRREFVRTLEA